nr:hypothetical protein [Tanacetum cinerariifolium]
MSSAFADTHNLVAILVKSDAGEGFDQIIDFLNGSYVRYALTVDPHIYVSCIKQFWNTAKDMFVVREDVEADIGAEHVQDDTTAVVAEEVVTTAALETVLTSTALDACAALTLRVEQLEHDKQAQTLEVTKLKKRVTKLERVNKVKTFKLRRLKKVGTSQRIETSDDTIMEDVSNQGKMIGELDRDEGVELIAIIPAAAPTVVPVTAAYSRRRKGVIIRDPEEESTLIKPNETKSKDKGKDDCTAGFKLDYLKGKSYDDICPIFKAKFNTNMDFLLKSKEQIEEEESRALESINETPAQKAAKRRRDDLETLWGIVQERFSTSKPNNFSDEYVLTTLRTMFGRPYGQDNVWKSQRSVHGQAMVKS